MPKGSIREVARLAKVSPSTVSLAINGNPRVSEKTRQAVLEAAHQINYVPNNAARALRRDPAKRQTTESIGFVYCDSGGAFFINPYFAQILHGAERIVMERSHHLLFCNLTDTQIQQYDLPRMLREGTIDGLIVVGQPSPQILDHLRDRHLACVLADCGGDYANFSKIGPDNVHGALAVMEHLSKLGHQRIATVAGSDRSINMHERLTGYRMGLHRHGLTEDSDLVVGGDAQVEYAGTTHSGFSPEAGYIHTHQLLKRGVKFTAVFAQADSMALGVILALREVGLDVPGDVSVVGFDDVPEPRQLGIVTPGKESLPLHHVLSPDLALTTIRVCPVEIGRTAARVLFEHITDPSAAIRRVTNSAEIVIRRTTAAVVS